MTRRERDMDNKQIEQDFTKGLIDPTSEANVGSSHVAVLSRDF